MEYFYSYSGSANPPSKKLRGVPDNHAMTFQQAQVAPWMVHRLVGDDVWNQVWGARAGNIVGEHMIPGKLLQLTTYIASATVSAKQIGRTPTPEERDSVAAAMYEATEAAKRRRLAGLLF